MSTRSRRKFTPEFKAEAVEMVEAAGGNITQVAKELGIYAWLRRQGYPTSRKRVARIMREHGWVGVSGRRRVRTTIVDPDARAAEDLVARNFNPAAPDVTWAGDITYIPTGEGWLFLATVIDLCSRCVIGWGVADHLRTPLVAAARDGPRRSAREPSGSAPQLAYPTPEGWQSAAIDN